MKANKVNFSYLIRNNIYCRMHRIGLIVFFIMAIDSSVDHVNGCFVAGNRTGFAVNHGHKRAVITSSFKESMLTDKISKRSENGKNSRIGPYNSRLNKNIC